MSGRVGKPALGEKLGPGPGDDLQEIQRHLPPLGEVARDETCEPRPVRALRLYLVHQSGEIAGKPYGIGE